MHVTTEVPAWDLRAGDIIESHDDLTHTIVNVLIAAEFGSKALDENRIYIRVRRADDTTYRCDFHRSDVVRVVT